jgi:aryl-alcohol dehydrogenase-like predicted oxidoreductase
MSEYYGARNELEATDTIRRAVELGVTFFDTADAYGPFANERLVGRALAGHRDHVVIATKFGFERRPDGTFVGINGRPEYVLAACDESLARLGIETIDLYYQHRVDPLVPIEETVGAMKELVAAGKVRYIGLSEAAPGTIRRAHDVHPLSALQNEYSLWTRDLETEVLPLLRQLGIGLVAYSPLGRGFLAGNITDAEDLEPDDWRRNSARFQGENINQNLELIEIVRLIAADHEATPAQIALAWVLAQGNDVVPIPGTKRARFLEENVAASDIRLSESDLRRLGERFVPGAVAGDRYPDMSRVDIEAPLPDRNSFRARQHE